MSLPYEGAAVPSISIAEHIALKAALATARAEAEALREEVARLREALEATRDHCPQCDGEGVYMFGPKRNCNEVPCEFCEVARAALAPERQP